MSETLSGKQTKRLDDRRRRRVHDVVRGVVGKKLNLLTLDDLSHRGRSRRIALQMRDQLVNDLGGDPSAAESALAQRASVLHALLEHLEAEWLLSCELDVSIYCAAAAEQRRMLVALGLKRVPRQVDLSGYIAEQGQDQAA